MHKRKEKNGRFLWVETSVKWQEVPQPRKENIEEEEKPRPIPHTPGDVLCMVPILIGC